MASRRAQAMVGRSSPDGAFPHDLAHAGPAVAALASRGAIHRDGNPLAGHVRAILTQTPSIIKRLPAACKDTGKFRQARLARLAEVRQHAADGPPSAEGQNRGGRGGRQAKTPDRSTLSRGQGPALDAARWDHRHAGQTRRQPAKPFRRRAVVSGAVSQRGSTSTLGM